MHKESVDQLMETIAEDMRLAMKNKNMAELHELRALMARISNAQAQPIDFDSTVTEIPRKILSMNELKAIINDEELEIQSTLSEIDADSEYASELCQKLEVVQRYTYFSPGWG